jgi:hypothetical protein
VKRILVHIDSLVLKGFRHQDRLAIAEGLRDGLARHFAEPQSAQHLVSCAGQATIKVGGLRIDARAGASQLGAQAARDIAGAVKS